jgi:O-acetylhomoserine/O-acetylserine sulfhydrylase-like pyridoxal-dependent enzyme
MTEKMAKTASLTAGLVAKKGHASPAVLHDDVDRVVTKTAAVGYYKALTVKLDRERYESLKSLGVKLDKKSQEIFVEALDLWIKEASLGKIKTSV